MLSACKKGVRGFWEAIRDGADLQRPVPLERWDVDRHFDPDGRPGAAYVRFAAFSPDADLADAAYFRLGRSEAVALDPQTRILLQVFYSSMTQQIIQGSSIVVCARPLGGRRAQSADAL